MTLLFKSCTKRLLADACTPVQLYLHVRDHYPETVLLETAAGTEGPAHSYICFDPLATISLQKGKMTVFRCNGITETTVAPDSLPRILAAFMQSFSVETTEPAGISGLHGFMSYGAARYMDELLLETDTDGLIPEMYFALYRFVLSFDLSSTVGSEAWNSRDLKSRPH